MERKVRFQSINGNLIMSTDKTAEYWFARLMSDSLSEEDVAELLAWCKAEPANEKAFQEIHKIWKMFEDLKDDEDLKKLPN